MFKKIINVIWTYSLQDYWRAIWSRTSLDEKAVATLKEIIPDYKKLTADDLVKAIRQKVDYGKHDANHLIDLYESDLLLKRLAINCQDKNTPNNSPRTTQ